MSNAEMKRVCLPATAAQPQPEDAAAAEEQPQQSSWGRAPTTTRQQWEQPCSIPASFQRAFNCQSASKHALHLLSVLAWKASRTGTQRSAVRSAKEINFKLKERKRNNNNKLLSILPLSTWKLQFVLCAHTHTHAHIPRRSYLKLLTGKCISKNENQRGHVKSKALQVQVLQPKIKKAKKETAKKTQQKGRRKKSILGRFTCS